jgi:hypothetical protein
MASTPVLIPRLFRNLGVTKTNGATILKTEVGSIIDFRSIRSINNNLFLKEYPEYVSFQINTDYFTLNSLTASYATFNNITSSVGSFTHLTGSRILATFLTSSYQLGESANFTHLTASYARLTQITGSHQKLINGSNAFVAGPGIIIQNHFGGEVGISSSLAFTPVKTTSYTAVIGDVILVDLNAGSLTIDLPVAASSNKNSDIIIKLYGPSYGNTLTIDPNGAQTIDNQSVITLTTDYASVWLKSDGSNWWRLA